MNINRILILLAILSLTACASAPRYTAANDTADYGYYSHKIATDRYRVSFNGGRHADRAETRAYALRRAAELTVSDGYDWFRIVHREGHSAQSNSSGGSYGGMQHEHGYTRTTRCGLLGCTESVRPTVTQHWGSVESNRSVSTYSYTIEIVMGSGEKPANEDVYIAEDVIAHPI